MTVHVIDSSRPRDLRNMFAAGELAERIVVWDDGGAEDLEEERKAFEAIEASCVLHPARRLRC
jgi:cell division control protein 45